ncbi:MAG: argininosuccinate synthase domain-containing protein [Pseudomonadota bacterium]
MSISVSLRQLEGKKVGLLAGGGLSSWVVARVLKDRGVNVRVYCADVAQDEEPMLSGFLADMEVSRIPVSSIDLRPEAAEVAIDLARYDARYRREYWNSTSALRMLLVRELAPVLAKDGCAVLAHGCVGGGNDERRFANYAKKYAPELEIFSPWRDLEMLSQLKTRADMVAYIAQTYPSGPLLESKATESVDGSLIGSSFESDWLEDLEHPWTEAPFQRSTDIIGAGAAETIRLDFSEGDLVGLNEKQLSPLSMTNEMNRRAGAVGVGRYAVIEDRISGAKMRGVYEAPALTVLGGAYRYVRQLALSERELDLFQTLSDTLGSEIYYGLAESDVAKSARAGMDVLNKRIAGAVWIRLQSGHAAPISFRHLEDGSQVKHQRRFGQGGSAWN